MTDQPRNPGQHEQDDSTPTPASAPGPVERLSAKLAHFQRDLLPDETALLSGIFSVAADTMIHSGDGLSTTQLVSSRKDAESAIMEQKVDPPQLERQLLEQFNSAFVADPEGVVPHTASFIIPQSPRPSSPSLKIIPARPTTGTDA